MFFRSRKSSKSGGAAVIDSDPVIARADELENEGKYMEAVEVLAVENRAGRRADLERRMVQLRHRAGAELTKSTKSSPIVTADFKGLDTSMATPEIDVKDMTPGLVRAALETYGCLIVRNVVPREEAIRMSEEIESTFEARDESRDDGYYEEFKPDPGYDFVDRGWVTDAGGVWAADAPKVMFDMVDAFDRVGLQGLVEGYLGEKPAFSVNKCTLRRVSPEAGTAWHQDGAFLGDVKALNVWLSLSRCGDLAPGLDIVPKRIDSILPTGTDDAIFDWSISDKVALEAAGDSAVIRPIFEPGDIVLFDDVCVHRTAAEKSMPNDRYAIESWFFGPSTFPDDYVPLAF